MSWTLRLEWLVSIVEYEYNNQTTELHRVYELSYFNFESYNSA